MSVGMLWTYVLRCRSCGRELNRAEHVPDEKRTRVSLTSVFAGFCPVREHNTASDFNLHFTGEWIAEEAPPATSAPGRLPGPEEAG